MQQPRERDLHRRRPQPGRDGGQIVPYADSAPLSVKLLRRGTLKTYAGLPHGMCTTHPEIINPDLLEFIRS